MKILKISKISRYPPAEKQKKAKNPKKKNQFFVRKIKSGEEKRWRRQKHSETTKKLEKISITRAHSIFWFVVNFFFFCTVKKDDDEKENFRFFSAFFPRRRRRLVFLFFLIQQKQRKKFWKNKIKSFFRIFSSWGWFECIYTFSSLQEEKIFFFLDFSFLSREESCDIVHVEVVWGQLKWISALGCFRSAKFETYSSVKAVQGQLRSIRSVQFC